MNRIVALIDGFNVYYSLDEKKKYHKYKWLDYRKLIETFCRPNDRIDEVYYFTALTNSPGKRKRHEIYIEALRLRGIKIIEGKIRMREQTCKATCKEVFIRLEEKQTDVNIAVKLIDLAINDGFDKVLVISGDTDLVPAYMP